MTNITTFVPQSAGAYGDVFGNAVTAAQGGTVSCFANTIAFTDATPKTLFVLPRGAVVVDYRVDVLTLFNDSGTDLLTAGTAADPDRYLDDVAGQTAATTRAGAGATTPVANLYEAPFANPTTIVGTYTGENEDATTGLARFYLWFVVRGT